MSCEVLWHDKIITLKNNNYYPVLIKTPNGETVESIDIVSNVRDHDTGELVAQDNGCRTTPKLIVKDINETDNKKSGNLSLRESKTYMIMGEASKNKINMMDDMGNRKQENMWKVLQVIDQNTADTEYSTFTVITQNLQNANRPHNLYNAILTVHMSNGQTFDITFKYICPSPTVNERHKIAVRRILYTFYHTLSNNTLTDNEKMRTIKSKCEEIYPDFTSSYVRAEESVKRYRRFSSSVDVESDDDQQPRKRTLVSFDAYILTSIDSTDAESGQYFVLVMTTGGQEWVVDNLETQPMLDTTLVSTTTPPDTIINSPDVYRGMRYRDIVSAATQRATEANHVLLWVKFKDHLFDPFYSNHSRIHFTMRNDASGVYANVTTNVFEYGLTGNDTRLSVITSLYNIAQGVVSNGDIVSIITPSVVKEDFILFSGITEELKNIDIDHDAPVNGDLLTPDITTPPPGDLDFDLLDHEESPLSPKEAHQHELDETTTPSTDDDFELEPLDF